MTNQSTADRIAGILNKLNKLEIVERHFSELETEENELIIERDKLEKQLTKELKDVEKLEGRSVKGMFYNILGSKATQLEKERQEYLELSLKHTQHLKSLELVQYEKEILGDKIDDLPSLRSQLQGLKKVREKEILATPSALRNELVENIRQMEATDKLLVQLEETHKMGNAILMSINRIISNFRRAHDWGNWDMAQRGRYQGNRRYSAINAAVNEAHRTNMMLKTFASDLRHLGYDAGHMALTFKSFNGFMNVLFDNLITDWIIQSKIKNALGSTEAVGDRVQVIMASLQKDVHEAKNRLLKLNEQKESILER